MLRPRLIPALLIHQGGLYKTLRFSQPKYVGDPINAVRIFNDKGVDELIVLDIDATRFGRPPDFGLIAKLASECRMPLCYGGGVATASTVERIISLGVEKVAIGAGVVENPGLIGDAARRVGKQSIVAVLDVKRGGWRRRAEVVIRNASERTGLDPVEVAVAAAEAGAGEILVNSVDRDGTMEGYDLELIRAIREAVHVPMSALGGVGSLEHIAQLYAAEGIIGAAAGSLFVFKGRYRAVLINYPSPREKERLFESVAYDVRMPVVQ